MAEAIGVGAAEKAAVVRHGVVSVAWLLLLALGPRALFLLLPRALVKLPFLLQWFLLEPEQLF